MNFPTDKKARLKIVLAGLIGVCVLFYALFAFVVSPTRAKRAETAEQIEGLEGDIDRAWKVIKRVNSNQEANRNTLEEIMGEADVKQYVLRPRLGNYLLPASEVIHACAAACGVEVKTIGDVGLSVVPQTATRKTPNAFRSYTVRVGVECGYGELTRFLKHIEECNPYLCVCALGITGQTGNPEAHMIGFDLQWPTWADVDAPGRIMEELSGKTDAAGDTEEETGS